ncbi:hypothetical protein GCM10009604_23370 [Corynebacterium aurimucosum]
MRPDLGGCREGVDKRLPYPSPTVFHTDKELHCLPVEGSHTEHLVALDREQMAVAQAVIPQPDKKLF